MKRLGYYEGYKMYVTSELTAEEAALDMLQNGDAHLTTGKQSK
jgi:hypothetical protein